MRCRNILSCWTAKAWTLVLLSLLGFISFSVNAHESRPAYLEIGEAEAGILNINWTRPLRDERALNIHPVFPVTCSTKGTGSRYQIEGLLHERWLLDCGEAELIGKQVSISGLENTISDVLLRFQRLDGSSHVQVLDSKNPTFVFPSGKIADTNVAPYYFSAGVKHILHGNDHLLFVFALLLLISGFWQVIKTITAFTLAHSFSLMAAVLGYVHIPSTPVEAVIALSIMFLAGELLRSNERSISRRWPWLIAAVFGLVHGLGFAGALSEIGLPEGEIPLALFMFNIGVEAGQVLFIIVATGMLVLLAKIMQQSFNKVEFVSTYAIGSIAAFWLIERVSNFY